VAADRDLTGTGSAGTPDVWPVAGAVGQRVGIALPGIFQGVRQDGHPAGAAVHDTVRYREPTLLTSSEAESVRYEPTVYATRVVTHRPAQLGCTRYNRRPVRAVPEHDPGGGGRPPRSSYPDP